MRLRIYTLGVFDIESDGISLLKDSGKAYKLYRLFQYFLTFKNEKILVEDIIQDLLEDHYSFDPNNMLRAQIYRLRKYMKSMIPEGEDEGKYMQIHFNNGYYHLDIGERVSVDTDEFEELIKLGNESGTEKLDNLIRSYKRALELYKGDYLKRRDDEKWLLATRNYYKDLYDKTIYKLIELLMKDNRYKEVIQVCQEGINHRFYEEKLHIYLMEAMLKLGRIKAARRHYEYTTFYLKEKMHISSLDFEEIYGKIQVKLKERGSTTIGDIEEKLKAWDKKEALLCEYNYFKFLFNIMKKEVTSEEERYLLLVEVSKDLKEDELIVWEEDISKALTKILSSSDAFTFWNSSQILVLYSDKKNQGVEKLERDIMDELDLISKNRTYNIEINSSLINSESF